MPTKTAKTMAPSTKRSKIPTTAQSVNNGIKFLKQAIKNKISCAEASKSNGKGKNYVYTIYEKIEKHKKSGTITNEQYKEFKSLYGQATR